MSANYWIARYVDDPFRNEPRNVGIIVSAADGIAARFAGERDDNTIDGRRLQSFKYADVYRQWIQFWREQIDAENVDGIVSATTDNYYVIFGGDVSDTGADGAGAICRFLYDLLVSDVPVLEAFELASESDSERELALDVDSTFRDWDILADHPTLNVRHPIRRKQPIRGAHATHEPSFSQKNGKLYVFEPIDFNGHRPKLLKERAGFMAYMFSDIRQASGDVETYSIVRPATHRVGEAIDYAKAVLQGESTIVNWADIHAREVFLRERKNVAESFFSRPQGNLFGPTGPAAPPALPSP